jgi:hypothetical protein
MFKVADTVLVQDNAFDRKPVRLRKERRQDQRKEKRMTHVIPPKLYVTHMPTSMRANVRLNEPLVCEYSPAQTWRPQGGQR